ncbi:alpha/beta fold hydrolase [Alkalicoccus urumqiensis]|uniref:Alpha/beta hydrolase n=1 Tax=Alkalicoccus urumqiensis TaxID=1548213 RepID=A0A2P6MLV2_ALKUR|nr:alpha/beta hydrolase [Alkalicoccus urumqiensis]PRO67274.1 alpha/beta hydrolase [Alkalicoccus urumqiensis]
MEARVITVNNVNLLTRTAGPEAGPLIVLLHGFPDSARTWTHLQEALAADGWFTAAPVQRGYDGSSRPENPASYHLEELRRDVLGLIQAFGRRDAVLIGHDWGGAVAWYTAAVSPESVRALLPINMPHPAAMQKEILRLSRQTLRSQYVAFFQLPRLPEKLLTPSVLEASLVKTANPGTFSEEELQAYREGWQEEDTRRTMIHWYRALRYIRFPSHRIQVPVRMLWGLQDPFLDKETAKKSLSCTENGRLIFVDDATHWIHHEHPALTARLVKELLASADET